MLLLLSNKSTFGEAKGSENRTKCMKRNVEIAKQM